VDHLVAFFAQRLDDEFADKWVVLDHQYSHQRLLNVLTSDTNLERPTPCTVPVSWPGLQLWPAGGRFD
jgi:hypothetical protein